MIGLLDVYLDLWREALGNGPFGARYTARLAILGVHAFVIEVVAFVIITLSHYLR